MKALRRSIFAAEILLAGTLTFTGGAAPATKDASLAGPVRLAIPGAAAQARAEKLVRDVFGNYSAEPANKRDDIAAKMVDQASTTRDDPDARYVLLKDAADLAAGAGDATVAMQAATLIAQTYSVDVGELKVDLLRKSAFIANTPAAIEAVVDEGLSTANDAAAAGDFDLAMKLMTPTEQAARGTHDAPLMQAIAARATELHWMQLENMRAKSAEQKLATNGNDPDANLTSGRFLCLVKKDWARGLPRLLKSSSPGFRAAAGVDMNGPTQAGQQVMAGDLWWDLGEKEQNGPQTLLRQRAAHWYAMALADANFSGLSRARVEKRVAAVPPDTGDSVSSVPRTAPSTQPAGPKTAPVKTPGAKPAVATKPPTGANPVPPANPNAPVPPVDPAPANSTPANKVPDAPATRPPSARSGDAPTPAGSIFSDLPK